jgi:hypothetical protein
MPIEPAQLANSLGALDSLDPEQGLEVALAQVLGSAKTLLGADRATLMLVDQTGALRWASGSDRVVEASAGDLSVPIDVGGGPVGTLDVYSSGSRDTDNSAAAALQAYGGLVASVLVAAVTARRTGRLADQLQAAAARGRILDAEAEQRRADRQP